MAQILRGKRPRNGTGRGQALAMPAMRKTASAHRDCAQERPCHPRRLGEKAIAQAVLEKAAAEAHTAEVLAEEAVRTGGGSGYMLMRARQSPVTDVFFISRAPHRSMAEGVCVQTSASAASVFFFSLRQQCHTRTSTRLKASSAFRVRTLCTTRRAQLKSSRASSSA